MKRLIAGIAMAAVLPLQTMAQDGAQDDSDAGFEAWLAQEGELERWAVISPDGETASYAEKNGDGPATVLTGQAAIDAIADTSIDIPTVIDLETDLDMNFAFDKNISVFTDGEDSDIKILKLEGDGELIELNIGEIMKETGIEIDIDSDSELTIDDDETHIIIERMQSGEPFDVEKLLEEKGISLNGTVTVDHNGEHKTVIIRSGKKKVAADASQEVDASREADVEGEAKKKTEIRVITMPTPPTPPTPPEAGDGFAWSNKDGRNVVVTTGNSMVQTWSSDEGGTEKRFIHMTGISADDAEEFIDDIEGLSRAQKREMKAALSL